MIGRLVPAVLLLVLFANYAAAQNTSSSGAGFCTTAPQELLVALDGSWSLTQGMGAGTGWTMVGGIPIPVGIAFPLPPQAPVGMTLTYDPDIGAAIMSGDGQQMIMMPTMTETAAQALGPDFEDLVGSAASGAECDWYALPTLVGTNEYFLSGGAIPPEYELLAGGTTRTSGFSAVFLCVNGKRIDAFLSFEGKWAIIGPDIGIGTKPSHMDEQAWQNLKPVSAFKCGQNLPKGDMSMTIALKFDSPSSGRGRVVYDGELDGSRFTVVAPVEMTR